MTNPSLQINKTDIELTIQFPTGEKIPLLHLLLHWFTLTIVVFSLFLLLFFLRWQGQPWLSCSLIMSYFLLPYYLFLFTPMVFLWNIVTDDYVELDATGLRLYRKTHFWARPKRSLSLNDIVSIHTTQPDALPFWSRWWGIKLLVIRFRDGHIKVENKQGLSFYFGWNVTPEEAEEVARLMNEHLAILKG